MWKFDPESKVVVGNKDDVDVSSFMETDENTSKEVFEFISYLFFSLSLRTLENIHLLLLTNNSREICSPHQVLK